MGFGGNPGRRRAGGDRAALQLAGCARPATGAGTGAAGGPDDADPGGDRRGAADGKEPGELYRRGRIGRESVRQDHERAGRADEAVFHAADRGSVRRRVDRLLAQGVNPRDAKEALGKAIVAQYHGDAAADQAAEQFRRRAAGEDPDEIPEVAIDAGKLDAEGRLPAFILVKELGLEASTSNARRVIEQGGVSISLDSRREPVTDPKLLVFVRNGLIVRVGKRKIACVRLV